MKPASGRAEEQRRRREVGRRAPTAERRAAHEFGVARRVGARHHRHRRLDPAGRQRVDADVVLGECDGQRLGQLRHAALAGRIGRARAARRRTQNIEPMLRIAPPPSFRGMRRRVRIEPLRLMSIDRLETRRRCSSAARRLTPAQLTSAATAANAPAYSATCSELRTSSSYSGTAARPRSRPPLRPASRRSACTVAPASANARPDAMPDPRGPPGDHHILPA